MKNAILFILLLISLSSTAQTSKHLDFKIGIGASRNFNYDGIAINFENEFNWRINKLFTAAYTMNFGFTIAIFDKTYFIQNNLNLFYYPFKQPKLSEFRIGTGLSQLNLLERIKNHTVIGGVKSETTTNTFIFPFGLNVIFENDFKLSPTLNFGVKAYTQLYSENNINVGIMFKTSIKL